MNNERWQITSVYERGDPQRLAMLLLEGWEPYAVVRIGADSVHYLRRRAA